VNVEYDKDYITAMGEILSGKKTRFCTHKKNPLTPSQTGFAISGKTQCAANRGKRTPGRRRYLDVS